MWTEIPAKDFCSSVRDGTHDSPKPVESGRYLVTSRHIIGGHIDLSNAYLISNDDFEAINKRSKVDRWDVLISMIGTVGEPCLVSEEPEFAIKNIGLFKTKSELDGRWLYYYLTSPQAQALIRQHSRGTTQAYVPLGVLRDFPVRVPNDREIMQAITNVLASLDDKIDLNRRINQTLEQIAQAIFKSWFVDFDPVKAKIAAKQEGRDPLRAAMNAISGKTDTELDQLPSEQYQQLAITAKLFPDEMVDSELGEIPRGWSVSKVETLLTRLPVKIRYTKDQVAEFGQTPVFEQGASILLGYHNASPGYQASLDEPAFIFGDHTCVTRLSCQPFDISQNVIPLRGRDRATTWVYYDVKEKQKFQEYRRHWMELVSKDVVIATYDLCSEFSCKVSILHLQMEENERESLKLRELRDTLLPKLLSGELSVNTLTNPAASAGTD